MKLSLNWLNDFVSTKGLDIKEFCSAMTMTGSKVEGFYRNLEGIEKVVVGKVLSIKKHENADKLVVCSVDTGKGVPLTIVTGATNLKENVKVPVCLDGGRLPSGAKIKESNLRGVVSQGMMCSLGELNLSKEDFSYAEEDGIFIIKENCSVGDDIRKALGMDDVAIDFEITSNRPDCLSIRGLAKEAAATFNRPFKDTHTDIKECGEKTSDVIDVEVISKNCKRYIARAVTDVVVKPSPKWMRNRLSVCGVRPINNIVDITNYVMLEYGQPMHAFDRANISGDRITVREAKEGETLTTLDKTECQLNVDTLLISDEKGALALAGVMGGDKSGISENTKTVIFESAAFDSGSVRRTSKRYGLRTESSVRFEKGLNPKLCEYAAERACELAEMLGAGRVLDGCIDVKNCDLKRKWIDFDADYINGFLGTDIPKKEMEKILKKLDFEIEDAKVSAPPYRVDIEDRADVAEEVARIYGYDKIKPTQYRGLSCAVLTPFQSFLRQVKQILYGFSLSEIYTYSFINPDNYDKMRLDTNDKLRDNIKIKNPIGEETSVMRTTLIPSMLEVLSKNYNNKNQNLRLYEISRAYMKKGEDVPACEREKLSIGIYGDCDFYTIKGYLTSLFYNLNITKYSAEACSQAPFHKYRCVKILGTDGQIGVMGEIDPKVLKNYNLGVRAYLLELDLESAFKLRDENIKFRPIAKYPAVNRDLSLICDADFPVGQIEKTIKKSAGSLLTELVLFDVYRGDRVDKSQKSVSYNLKFLSAEGTLKDKEVDNKIKDILNGLKSVGVYLRE